MNTKYMRNIFLDPKFIIKAEFTYLVLYGGSGKMPLGGLADTCDGGPCDQVQGVRTPTSIRTILKMSFCRDIGG